MPGPTRPERLYHSDAPLSEEQLSALGRIAVEAGELESLLEWGIWRMLALPAATGRLFTTGQSLELKVKTFIRVAQKVLTDKDIRQQASQVAAQMRDSSGRRNDAIHAVWRPAESGNGATAFTTKLGDKAVIENSVLSDVASLLQIAADLRSDCIDLMAFLVDAGLRIADESHAP
jgi:hypothetical protein